jgi:hypothetical protein
MFVGSNQRGIYIQATHEDVAHCMLMASIKLWFRKKKRASVDETTFSEKS